jgi:hypothetical protein
MSRRLLAGAYLLAALLTACVSVVQIDQDCKMERLSFGPIILRLASECEKKDPP